MIINIIKTPRKRRKSLMKKHFKLSLNQKPRLRISKENLLNDLTNEKFVESIAMKKMEICNDSQTKNRLTVSKNNLLHRKSSYDRIATRSIQPFQERNMHQDSSKVKIIVQQKSNSPKPSRDLSLNKKPRAMSSIFSKQPYNSFERSIVDLEQYRQYYHQLEQALRQRRYISNFHSQFLTIKHDKFYELIVNVIKHCNSLDNGSIDPVRKVVLAIKDHFIGLKCKEKQRKYKLMSKAVTFQHNPQKFRKEELMITKKMYQIIQKNKQFELGLEKKQELVKKADQIYSLKLKQIQKIQRKLYNLQESTKQQDKKLKHAESQYLKKQKDLILIQEKYQFVTNFIQNQERSTILKDILSDFKQIQSQIFEYAVYLQSNQLANDINFEPRPFTQIEDLINQDMKDLIITLTQSDQQEKSFPEKCKLIKKFIGQTMRKFKNKDAEMLKVCEFRAKCILTFVKKMKRWLCNWELKKQYLVNLKKEFLALSTTFKEQINTLTKEEAQGMVYFQARKLNEILGIYKRLQEIFFYGNSFY